MQIEHVRATTPGLQSKLFVNSAGASLMDERTVAAVRNYLDDELMESGYELANRTAPLWEDFYRQAALLLGAKPHQIAFCTSATDGYAKALSAIPFKPGDVVLTTADDYVSNQFAFFQLHARFGVRVERIRDLDNDDLDLDDLAHKINTLHPKLVAVTHVPTNSGKVQPVHEVGALCALHDVLFLLDACQSVGQMVVDVNTISCDFLVVTGRKFLRGPRGTGILYVSDRVLTAGLTPLSLDSRGATWTGANAMAIQPTARRFEYWELSYANVMGITEALRQLNAHTPAAVQARNEELMQHLRNGLQAIDGCSLWDFGTHLSAICTIRVEGMTLTALQAYLKAQGVIFSVSVTANAYLDFTRKNIDGVIRFSPHYFNTFTELDELIALVAQCK